MTTSNIECELLRSANRRRNGMHQSVLTGIPGVELLIGEVQLRCNSRADRFSKRLRQQTGRVDVATAFSQLECRLGITNSAVRQQENGQAAANYSTVCGARHQKWEGA